MVDRERRLRRVERVATGSDGAVEVRALAILARGVAGRDDLLAAVGVAVRVVAVAVLLRAVSRVVARAARTRSWFCALMLMAAVDWCAGLAELRGQRQVLIRTAGGGRSRDAQSTVES